jgi:hypothetical protein
MSQIVTTNLGRFRRVVDGPQDQTGRFLFECRCGTWLPISDEQMDGKMSIWHIDCGYHETHEYGKALVARLAAARLMEENPVEEDA